MMRKCRVLSTSVTRDGVGIGCVLHVTENGPYRLWPIHDRAPMTEEFETLRTAVRELIRHDETKAFVDCFDPSPQGGDEHVQYQ